MKKKLFIPPPISDFLQENRQSLPEFTRPIPSKVLSPKRFKHKQRGLILFLFGLGVIILKGGSLILWIIGLIFLEISLSSLMKSIVRDYEQVTQKKAQDEQYKYQQAQNLLKRYQTRRLNKFLQNKVKRGQKKGYKLNPSQRVIYQSLKAQFPHCQLQLGEEVNGIVIPISLVSPVTGLALAIFFDSPEEETVKQLLNNYWIVWNLPKKVRL